MNANAMYAASNGMDPIGDVGRFSGLVSGLDTEGIVKKLMAAERQPLNKLLQQKQWLSWQRDAYREVNRALFAFQSLVSNLRLTGSFLKNKAVTSRDDLVGVTATGSAMPGSHTVIVQQLARAAQVVGEELTKTDGTRPSSTDALSRAFGVTSGALEFKITVTDPANPNLLRWATVTVADAAGATIQDIISQINAAKGVDADGQPVDLGVRAAYEPTLGRIVLQTKEMGAVQIEITDTQTAPTSNGTFGFVQNLLGTGNSTTTAEGQQARVTVDGVDVYLNDNRLSVFGLDMVLKSADPNARTTITVSRDIDAVVERIRDFVDQYNALLADLNKRLSEPRYRDYPPLLDEQKAQMSEKQIEQWEERAKSGLLARDPLVDRLVGEMRLALFTPVEIGGKSVTLSAIGITTGSYWEKGLLKLDEGKLREALAQDPDRVAALFSQKLPTNAPEADQNNRFHAVKGLAVRLYEILGDGMNQLKQKAGSDGIVTGDQSVLGGALRRLDDQIAAVNRRLKDVEARYWREFTAMEKAIQRANMQSMWLMQAIGASG